MTPWNSIEIEYDASDQIKYLGKNKTLSAPVEDKSWYISKFTWNGSGNLTNVNGPVLGKWSERVILLP